MKDKLLYLTIGLLIGIVIMQLGITSKTVVVPVAQAGYVDHNTNGVVCGLVGYFLDENGMYWRLQSGGWVSYDGYFPLPVPVSQIKIWDVERFITTDNRGYEWEPGGWVDCGVWPGGQPVPTEKQSWGSIKGNYDN